MLWEFQYLHSCGWATCRQLKSLRVSNETLNSMRAHHSSHSVEYRAYTGWMNMYISMCGLHEILDEKHEEFFYRSWKISVVWGDLETLMKKKIGLGLFFKKGKLENFRIDFLKMFNILANYSYWICIYT